MRRRHFVLSLAASAATACTLGPERADSRIPTPPSGDDLPANEREILVGGATIRLVVEGSDPALPIDDYHAWVQGSAQMIADYYGGPLPVPGFQVTLNTTGRGGVGYGHHQDGRWIDVHVGRRATPETLSNDWVMVHEMLHATFPDLSDRHRWMQEGLSTYLEKIVRVRAGNIDEATVWQRLTRMMHHGRPRRGDRGLDKTHTWGRTYWGGALFWMVADVELRSATDNRRSLRDSLLQIAAVGGNGRENWSTDRVVEQCDKGAGNRIVSKLYDRMALAPGDVDLDTLWLDLGIILDDDRTIVRLEDDAPLAFVRHGICSA